MAPVSAIHRATSDLFMTVIQVSGSGFRIEIDVLHQLMVENAVLQTQLGHYAHTVATQSAHAVFSLSATSVEPRIARLPLMFHDRIEGNDLSLTHLSISRMLAVRRPTTTSVINRFRVSGLIRATRAKVSILDRAGLETAAGEAYGAPEREYRRLIGLAR
jgi:CRP-like cAMP-binding protein